MARYIDADVLIKRMKPVAEYEYNDTRRKAFNEILDYVQKMPTTNEAEIREQAITEFAGKMKADYVNSDMYYILQNNNYAFPNTSLKMYKDLIDEIATELKGE